MRFKKGNRVKIIRTKESSIPHDYLKTILNKIGTIKVKDDSGYGVKVDGVSNIHGTKHLFWFSNEESKMCLKHVDENKSQVAKADNNPDVMCEKIKKLEDRVRNLELKTPGFLTANTNPPESKFKAGDTVKVLKCEYGVPKEYKGAIGEVTVTSSHLIPVLFSGENRLGVYFFKSDALEKVVKSNKPQYNVGDYVEYGFFEKGCNEKTFKGIISQGGYSKQLLTYIYIINGREIKEDNIIGLVNSEPDLLTKEEREYLSYVIKPFRNKIINIEKRQSYCDSEFISIGYKEVNGTDCLMALPNFKEGEHYRGLVVSKEYKLKDLGL